MKVTARAGTPHHMEDKECKTPSEVKKFLGDRVFRRHKWAKAHNLKMAEELLAIKEEIDSTDVNKVKVGESRMWSSTDDYSGVVFVFAFSKDAP